MNATRRGFFGLLAALPFIPKMIKDPAIPAIVMGRRAIAEPVPAVWYPRFPMNNIGGCEISIPLRYADQGHRPAVEIICPPVDRAKAMRGIIEACNEYERRTGRKIGSHWS